MEGAGEKSRIEQHSPTRPRRRDKPMMVFPWEASGARVPARLGVTNSPFIFTLFPMHMQSVLTDGSNVDSFDSTLFYIW